MRRAAIALLAAGLLTGCARLGSYLRDRGASLGRCFTAQAGLGLPAAIEVGVTDLLTTGAGGAVSLKAGFDGGEWLSARDLQVGFPVLPFALWLVPPQPDFQGDYALTYFYTYASKRTESWLLLWNNEPTRVAKSILFFDVTALPRYRYHCWVHAPLMGLAVDKCGYDERPADRALDLHVDVTLLVSVRLGFSPVRFAEFLLGCAGVGPAGRRAWGTISPELAKACGDGDVAAVTRFLAGGADPNARDENVWALLHIAVAREQRPVVAALLAAGARTNAPGAEGNTPLYYAVLTKNREIAGLLLAKGADPNAGNAKGWTPFHQAVDRGDKEMTELLLSKGADPNVRDRLGRTPLHIAAGWGDPTDIAELLLAKGAKVNARDHLGRTPLHAAAGGTRLVDKMAALLVARGADVKAREGSWRTAADLAEERGCDSLATYLRSRR